MITDSDGKPGLRIESAASVLLRDTISKHAEIFAHVMLHDRVAGRSCIAAYVDGLAGALALQIAGGHVSHEEGIEATIAKLCEAVQRDLKYLRKS